MRDLCLYGEKIKSGWGWFYIRETNGMVALTPHLCEWPLRIKIPWYIREEIEAEDYHWSTTMIYFPFNRERSKYTFG